MKMFIWQSVSGLTDSYHDGGGLAVVAASLEQAWLLAPAAKDEQPDKTYNLADSVDEEVFIFPDQGCC